jgi:spore coat protein U-like protein
MTTATRNALIIALAMLATGTAFAGTESSDLQVSAEVVSNCTISTTDLNFGVYDPIGVNAEAPLNSAGEVIIQCTLGSEVTVALDNGQHSEVLGDGGGSATRHMASSVETTMQYGLYGDKDHQIVWGATPESNVSMTLTVHGSIPAGQNPAIGSYTDVVTATVEFF